MAGRGAPDAAKPGAVALTFDDGPHPAWTPLVLDALARSGARATFFVVAPLAARHPALVRRMRDSGHGVALHCARHLRHDRLSRPEIEADARTGVATLGRLGEVPGGVPGAPVHDWRAPWGVVTPRTEEVALSLRLRLVGWTADTQDWRGDPAPEMLARVGPLLGPEAIVLMHDGVGPGARRDGCEETVALVEPLVELARSRDLEPATLDGLFRPLPRGNPGPVSRD